MGSPGIVVRTKGILVVGSGDQQVWIQPTTLLSDVTAAEPEEMDDGDEELERWLADHLDGDDETGGDPGDEAAPGADDPGAGRSP